MVVFVADLGEKEALLTANPKRFRTTPHYDGWPIVLVHLPSIGKTELAELLTDAWRSKAPKRVLKAFDDAGGKPPRP